MKLHKPSRSWSSATLNQELQLRRQVSIAVAQYRLADCDRPADLADVETLTPLRRSHSHPQLQAHLVPIDEQGKPGTSCQIVVKDFDERGITFHHPQPLHDRRALVVLEGLKLGRIAAEVDLSWCRFTSRGQYTSGGRFVQLVSKTA